MSQHTKRILILDDEPHVTYVTRYMLQKAAHTVIVGTNGKDGYDIACRELPDAIVTDYQMPGGDGLEMARRLRANPDTAHIPVVLPFGEGVTLPHIPVNSIIITVVTGDTVTHP